MTALGALSYLRPCEASDDAFLYDVFATTWESEVAALPNQKLAQHVLRIQHIAQERRYAGRHAGLERFVVTHDGFPAGRVYVEQTPQTLHLVDLTLLPEFRSRGLGSQVVRDLSELAAADGRTVTVRVSRRNREAAELCAALGFDLVGVDDLDHTFVWSPTGPDLTGPATTGPSAAREDLGEVRAMKESEVGRS